MKKLLKILIVTLLITVSGCTKPVVRTAEEFEAYLDELLVNTYSSDNFGINFSFEDPEAMGIEQGLYVVGFTTREDYVASFDFYEEAITELNTFSDNVLSQQQRYDRDAMIDYFERELPMKDFYDFEVGNNTIGYLLSTNTQLSVYLDVYAIRTKLDVDGYMNMMKTLPEYYQQYADLEIERQTNGTGYGQEELDKIIAQAQVTVDSIDENYFLVKSFNDRLDGVTFLSESEKDAYKAQNIELLNNEYKEAYQILVDKLSTIKAGESVSIIYKTNGLEYYQALFNRETGVSRSLSDVTTYLNKKYTTLQTQLSIILMQNPDFEEMLFSPTYKSFSNSDDMLTFLLDEVENGDDFPATNNYSYEIRKVDESMEENSSPAFYFTPTVDYQAATKQFIYINGEYTDELYSTMAHEGAPGHMYQFNYFLTLDSHPVRMIYTTSANAEGWAVYAENYATKYYTNEQFSNFSSLYQQLVNVIYTQMELGVNYEGWSFDEFKTEFTSMFSVTGDTEEEKEQNIKDVYLHFVHNPSNYAMYFMSYLTIMDLQDEMKSELGNKYTDYRFHEMLLQSGSTSFDVIRKHMSEYIETIEG